jgi:DNA repair protein RadD
LKLRPYQADVDARIDEAYRNGAKNVLLVMPCRTGKTLVVGNQINKEPGACVAIAHRAELTGQMSRWLGRLEIKHRILGPKSLVRAIITSHIIEFGRDFYDPSAHTAVASVDTLMSWSKPTSPMHDVLMRWAPQVRRWFTDEAHHICGDGSGNGNKWGRAIALFPNALGLGVTATPCRTDGKGLGRHADGPFDAMVEGPAMREAINGLPDWDGNTTPYLTDYRIVCPQSDLDLSNIGIGSDGDFIRTQLATRTKSSSIMGDVVKEYIKRASGKLGVTFAPDVETATTFSKLFNEAGVRAEVVTAKTPEKIRTEILKRFSRREIMQIVNVDLFGEGVDLPAMEVVSMARATQSFGLYTQQFSRPLTLSNGKTEKALIIDHVGNVLIHKGPPDQRKVWTLDRRERRCASNKDPNEIPMRVCGNPDIGGGVPCAAPYERVLVACPYCGWVPVPTSRTSPEQVDGDLHELDEATLAAMRGEVLKVDRSADDIRIGLQRSGAAPVVYNGAAKQHVARQEAQAVLRDAGALWMGYQKAQGRDVREAQRRFYFMFGVDVLSMQALGRPEAEELTERVYRSLTTCL